MNRRRFLQAIFVLNVFAAPMGCQPTPPPDTTLPQAGQTGSEPVQNDAQVDRASYSFVNPDNGKRCELVMTPLYVKGEPLRFIEHVFDFENNRSTRQVLAGLRARRNVILVSDDLAESWLQTQPLSFAVGQVFSTGAGTHLVWDEDSSKLRRFNRQWEEQPVDGPVRFCWHGAQGIGRHGDTIMFAEYWTDASVAEGHVLRSTDDGKTWSIAFSFASHGSGSPKSEQIRHFHTLQPDFYHPGHWYLSSGDDTPECRLWLTKDDGETWREVTDATPEGSDLQNVHRHTSVLFFPDRIVWATDGAYRKGTGAASFVEAKRAEPLEVRALSVPIANAVRSIVATDIGIIAFTENRNNRIVPEYGKTGAEIVLLTSQDRQVHVGIDPDGDGGFTYSLASRQAVGGVFLSFVYHKGSLTNLVRWSLSEL